MRPHARTPARTRQLAAQPGRRVDVGGGAPQPPASPRAPAAGRERECHPWGGEPRTARSRSTDRCDGERRLACANGAVACQRHAIVTSTFVAARSPGTLFRSRDATSRHHPAGRLPARSHAARYAGKLHHEEKAHSLQARLAQAGRRKTYPTPRTVWMNWGADGSPSSWLRSQWMCTSTVRVSPA